MSLALDGWLSWLGNAGIEPGVRARILNSLIAALVLTLVYQLLHRSVVLRLSDLRLRYRSQKILGYIFFALALLVIGPIWISGVQSLATYLGLLSAGLAIALRDPIIDIIGWLFILLRRPFDVGDRIQVGTSSGDVVDQGVFQFTLMEIGNWVDAEQSTGRLLHLPNSLVFTSVIANYSKAFEYIWNEISVVLAFDSNWEKAKQLVEQVANEQVEVPDYDVEELSRRVSMRYMIQYGKLTPIVYTSVKDKGIQLTLRYLCEPRQRRDSTHQIWENLLRTFSQHPDVRFAGQTAVVVAEAVVTEAD